MPHTPQTKFVKLGQLTVDPAVQRGLDRGRAQRIAEALNLDALGVLTVSKRNGDALYHVIDGQHRAEALRLAGFGEADTIECRVFAGLDLAEEAAMFRLLNNTRVPQPLDRFRVRVIEGERVAVSVASLIETYGWHLSGSREKAFAAVTALERVWRVDNDAAEHALATIAGAWGHVERANDGRIVEGLAMVFIRYGDGINAKELIDKLARFPGGPGALIGRARGLTQLVGVKVPQAVAEIVVELYNKARKTRALPPWRAL